MAGHFLLFVTSLVIVASVVPANTPPEMPENYVASVIPISREILGGVVTVSTADRSILMDFLAYYPVGGADARISRFMLYNRRINCTTATFEGFTQCECDTMEEGRTFMNPLAELKHATAAGTHESLRGEAHVWKVDGMTFFTHGSDLLQVDFGPKSSVEFATAPGADNVVWLVGDLQGHSNLSHQFVLPKECSVPKSN